MILRIIAIITSLCYLPVFISDISAQEAVPYAARPHVATIIHSEYAGKYLYLELLEGGESVWIATMTRLLDTEVSEGDRIEYQGGVPLRNFRSGELNKTFESIRIITSIKVLDDKSLHAPPHHHPKEDSKAVFEKVPPQE